MSGDQSGDNESFREFSFEIPDDENVAIDGDKIILNGNAYPLEDVKTALENEAKDNARATVTLTTGGVTVGAAVFGPPGGVAGAIVGSSIGYLVDKGYISWKSDDEAVEIELEEAIQDVDPIDEEPDFSVGEDELPEIFDKHSDKWYEPDSDNYILAVRPAGGGRAYFKTTEGAATRLREEYE